MTVSGRPLGRAPHVLLDACRRRASGSRNVKRNAGASARRAATRLIRARRRGARARSVSVSWSASVWSWAARVGSDPTTTDTVFVSVVGAPGAPIANRIPLPAVALQHVPRRRGSEARTRPGRRGTPARGATSGVGRRSAADAGTRDRCAGDDGRRAQPPRPAARAGARASCRSERSRRGSRRGWARLVAEGRTRSGRTRTPANGTVGGGSRRSSRGPARSERSPPSTVRRPTAGAARLGEGAPPAGRRGIDGRGAVSS